MKKVNVSIIIKALNEERSIVRSVESALRAVASVGGEVILADSCSHDRTVELAAAYPIVIIELANPNERCCGIAPQLGYQHALGEFVYVLDGDMEMHVGFLEAALKQFAEDPQLAGVGGVVVEKNLESLEYQARVERAPSNLQPGIVDRLDGGGLYRRSAIEQVGYLTDRNLHSYEEFDLGIRLRARGWKLRRVAVNAVDHYGHTIDAVTLLFRRWRSGYVWGIGEVLRASLGHPHAWLLMRELRELHLYITVFFWWVCLLLVWTLPISLLMRTFACTGLLLFPVVVMTMRKRSLVHAAYSVFAWCVATAGLVRGFVRPRVPADGSIASRRRQSALTE